MPPGQLARKLGPTPLVIVDYEFTVDNTNTIQNYYGDASESKTLKVSNDATNPFSGEICARIVVNNTVETTCHCKDLANGTLSAAGHMLPDALYTIAKGAKTVVSSLGTQYHLVAIPSNSSSLMAPAEGPLRTYGSTNNGDIYVGS